MKRIVGLVAVLFLLGIAGSASAAVIAIGGGGTFGQLATAPTGETGDSFLVSSSGVYEVSIADCCLIGDFYAGYLDGALFGTTPTANPTTTDPLSSGIFTVFASAGQSFTFIDVLLRDFYLSDGTGVGPGGWTIPVTYSPAGFSVSFTQVPEPTTLILLGSGLFGLGFWRRFKA